ncbi:transposase (plasmid) [Streptomyces sp. NBC_00257]|uniref:transposase n=1 Tax=Streptomyces sp. NBC_00062 TaxID=2975637 RepID=UPI00224D452D|nr:MULTISPECIES: transposase [unclassified Streptomyces]MCX5434601.1 transposase [Streptomyces sp. NBC_00062]
MDDLFVTIGHRFSRVELRRRMRDYVRGLLAPVARKNSWQLAEQAGHATPDGLQHLLAGAKWEPDDIRDELQEYVAHKLGEEDGVLIIDDTGFIKKGTTSAGVGLFAQAPDEAWEKISCGNGAKGLRVYHWAAVRLPAVAEFDYQGEVPHRMRWALARRSIRKPDEIAYYLAYAPLETTAQELVRIAGTRWAIEECFQAAKNECGLDQYEVRRYPGWYRHITLAMLAHAFLAATAHQAREKGAERVRQPGPSSSQWRRFGDSWQLVGPGPRTCTDVEADTTR